MTLREKVAKGVQGSRLLDLGYMNPTGVVTRLTIRLPWKQFEVTDALTGEPLTVTEHGVPLNIPSGGFRALEGKNR